MFVDMNLDIFVYIYLNKDVKHNGFSFYLNRSIKHYREIGVNRKAKPDRPLWCLTFDGKYA